VQAPFTHVCPSGQVPQQSDRRVTQRLELGHFTSGAQHSPLPMQRPSHSRVPVGQTHILVPLQIRPPLQSAFTQQPPSGLMQPSHLLVLVLHVWPLEHSPDVQQSASAMHLPSPHFC
jgi:hypothetical protein